MPEHTPGPWVQSFAFIHGGDSVHVCTLNYFDHGVAQANARLIAAGPDLLAACEKAFRVFHGTGVVPETCEAIDLLEAAIAKAKGTADAPR